ncbi:hypothetical protein F25303_2201 [Fusarium sp. NRRL 25303]|nr:hypothetical protein F25303_2201 [Fusarium sp. NRRL 25303]
MESTTILLPHRWNKILKLPSSSHSRNVSPSLTISSSPVINNAPKQNPTKHFLFYSILVTHKNIFFITAMNVPTWELNHSNIGYHGGNLLKEISPTDSAKCSHVFKVDFFKPTAKTIASRNGFISAAAEVFDKKTGLLIRVDDIWLAVLALLKPHICQVFHPQQTPESLSFTRAELNDKKELNKRLCAMVDAKFGTEVAKILMPHFSTAFLTDSVAAALILLGTNCQSQYHRKLEKPMKPNDRGPIVVWECEEDWKTLRETLAKLGNKSRQLDDIIYLLNGFMDKLRGAGYSNFRYGYHNIAFNVLNPGP